MIEIIIPTLNEASHLETLLTDLLAREENVRITLADGGSTDGTWDLAGRFPVRRQLLNLALVGLYHLGVTPDRLKRLYADARPHLGTR
jgi:hypothetical protein